jgi:hypothetical protein
MLHLNLLLTLMDSSDVHITTTTGSIAFITEVTAEFFSLMNSSDVDITITTGSIGFITEVTAESLTLMASSDVSITTTTGFEGSFTKIAVESHTLMNSSDVVRTTTLGSIAFITEITVKSLTLMDSSDVYITTTTGCERSVTFTATAAIYFLHFYRLILCSGFSSKLFVHLIYVKVRPSRVVSFLENTEKQPRTIGVIRECSTRYPANSVMFYTILVHIVLYSV